MKKDTRRTFKTQNTDFKYKNIEKRIVYKINKFENFLKAEFET